MSSFRLMKVLLIILFEVLNFITCEVPRPIGVSLSRAYLYTPEKQFVCFDGSITVPFTYINDNYCDCIDGSDEPGTSACANGSFYCDNIGHKPVNIPSSRVNDGICDCCDGSDEYTTRRRCPNSCNELGMAARLEQQRIAEITKIGYQVKLDYCQKGLQLKQEKKDQLVKLQKHKLEAELIQKAKETLKQKAEELESSALEKYKYIEEQERLEQEKEEAAKTRAEATEAFQRFDSDKNGAVDIAELQVRETFDKDRNGEVSLEEAKFFLNEQDSVDLEKFISEAWPLIKPFLMRDAGIFKPPEVEKRDDVEEDVDHTDEPSESDIGDEFGEYAGEDEEEDDGETAQVERVEETTTTESPPPSKYDEETQNLIDNANSVRKEYDSASQDVRDIQTEISNIENYLEKDYGPDEEFAILHGQCFEYADHEYIYKLCPFDKTIQQQKSSSSETRLGTWSKWAGSEPNKYNTMLFDSGQHCWNGPQRSTTVKVACGSENKVTAVSEPNRCEYEFEFVTPALCKESVVTSDIHDEL